MNEITRWVRKNATEVIRRRATVTAFLLPELVKELLKKLKAAGARLVKTEGGYRALLDTGVTLAVQHSKKRGEYAVIWVSVPKTKAKTEGKKVPTHLENRFRRLLGVEEPLPYHVGDQTVEELEELAEKHVDLLLAD